MDDLAGELDGNSRSTFGHLNSEVGKHSSALEDVRTSWYYASREPMKISCWLLFELHSHVQLFKGIASEADALLNDLQKSLHSQEDKVAAYAQQQREVGIFLTKYTSW